MLKRFHSDKIDAIISKSDLCIRTIEMHTGGEPLRVVTDGYPQILGNSVLEKRAYCKTHLDHLRKFLMYEPRGHSDMYGCLIVEPNDEGADFGIIFMHNEGYSTMCGHATIAIAKLAVQLEWVEKKTIDTKVVIDAPCGRLIAFVDHELKVRFQNVPSFVFLKNQVIHDKIYGNITFDIAYGGAFYAIMESKQFNIEIVPENIQAFIQCTKKIKQKINENLVISHPFEQDLSFLYGCIFVEASNNENIHSRNICVFADGEVDRSPTGSGVSARIALHMAKNEVELNQEIIIESVIESQFKVKAIERVYFGPYQAYIPEVSGEAFITGRNEFIIEKEDLIKEGFLLK